ncbi:phosphoglycolate phosphatase [Rhizobium sp. Root274]|uniref:HAD family hydrolase n=1 Tax=unclassified Rhizobium TaxID=2613769 RepID=UPI00071590B2|nr:MULTISPECIES: HAD family hydrolase [unclassified Rhizobium]KQW28726.1 phosphoglycolate phosphatase [Rhizobium sp. Root1240]KRD29902.1 phosphoglycolate phosphatase [Rhizobium sp. Root274]
MTSPATTIVFDLDGTLVDTAPDLVASLNHTIAIKDMSPVGYEDLTHLVGQGARVMIARAFALRGAPLAEEELPALLERFIDHYAAGMPGQSRPYPGLIEALERLRDAGHLLAVCTNKMEGLARPLIEKLGLTGYFAAITGGDTFAVRKPDAAHLTGTVEMAGGVAHKALMIGDSINDILAARNAGIPSIAVPFGYSDVAVDTLGASTVIGHFDELTLDLVQRLTGQA